MRMLARPTMPVMPTIKPPAAATAIHLEANGCPGSLSAPVASTMASAPLGNAHTSATRGTRARGTRASSTEVVTGAAITAIASVSLVTQAPECRGVAGAELGEDPLMEDSRDEDDQR